MRKAIFLIIVFLSVVVLLVRFSTRPIASMFGLQQRAGLRVEVNVPSKVFIDKKEVGKTPFQEENLGVGDHYIEVMPIAEGTASGLVTWSSYIRLQPGTLSVVNRELGSTQANSSGEVITLEPGNGVALISNPDGAEVEVDEKVYGRTPLAITDLLPGEHVFFLSKQNFLKRSIRANLVEGFKLTINVDLAVSEADLTKIPTVPIQSSPIGVVKQTPVGFLRVRASASANSAEVSRVAPGDVLIILEELPGWYRIRTPDNKEGFVSSAYLTKR